MNAMNATAGPSCALTCCPALSLAEVLECFRHEAAHGRCHTGRYQCSYYSWGSGPPLLFIPGLCDGAMSFVMPIALLAGHFRCIAYDLPAGPEVKRYRHADYVADLAALIDHLELDECSLFGFSFGSTIALEAMRQWPARLPHAVLQGGFARRPLGPGEVLLASLARYWPWPLARLPLRVKVLEYAHRGPFLSSPLECWDYFLDRQGAPPMSAVARRALCLHRLDLRPRLAKVQQPILMICGEFDHLVDKNCEQALLDGLPQVERVELAGCGHMPQFSHPAAMAEVTRAFLMSRSAAKTSRCG